MAVNPIQHSTDPQRNEDHAELVASLFETRIPATIMSGLFVIVAGLAALRSGDRIVAGLLALGTVVSMIRLTVLFAGRRQCDAGTSTPLAWYRLERRFAVSYIAFAAVFGCLAARVLALPLPLLHLPTGILVVGYAAGVAATVSLRPGIALPSLLVSVLPAALVVGLGPLAEDRVSALCLLLLLAGGLRSLSRRYASQTARSAQSRAYAALARRDPLTGLANRLALGEAASVLTGSGTAALPIAVHYMDLDDFKLVNDQLGHLAGDELLRAVATRLRTEAFPGDMVVRLGGDEFVLVQTGIAAPGDVDERARRIEEVLGVPFRIDGLTVSIGVSVGCSRPVRGMVNFDLLLGEADAALRARKLERKRGRQAIPSIVLASGTSAALAH